MVDALDRAHGWLRPEGFLVDIRPTAEPAYLEVELAAGVVTAGRVGDVNQDVGPNARHARADTALATAIERGWFVHELRLEFAFHRYAETVEELRDHVHGDWMGARIAAQALQRAAALARSEPGARLRVREQIAVARLRPVRAGSPAGLRYINFETHS
jgi:hypothetical protein